MELILITVQVYKLLVTNINLNIDKFLIVFPLAIDEGKHHALLFLDVHQELGARQLLGVLGIELFLREKKQIELLKRVEVWVRRLKVSSHLV